MHNITIERQGHMLVLTIDTRFHGRPSATGKSDIVASTEGNVEVPGTNLKLGLNIFRPLAPKTVPFLTAEQLVSITAMQAASVAKSDAVNDHTCPSCHNTKCSKTETTCWKCGGAL